LFGHWEFSHQLSSCVVVGRIGSIFFLSSLFAGWEKGLDNNVCQRYCSKKTSKNRAAKKTLEFIVEAIYALEKFKH